MSALPINPTPEQLMQAWREMPSMTNLADIFAGFHQAGVEAERARAAAETTEEWAAQDEDGTFIMGDPPTHGEAATIAGEMDGAPLFRRRTYVGPWEVQS